MHINLQLHFEALEQAAPWIFVPWWILQKGKWITFFRRFLYVPSAELSLYIIGCKTNLRGNLTKCLKIILATSVDCCENIAYVVLRLFPPEVNAKSFMWMIPCQAWLLIVVKVDLGWKGWWVKKEREAYSFCWRHDAIEMIQRNGKIF